MIIFLCIALAYLLITTGILYLNRRDFTPLQSTRRHYFDRQAPETSICIPARNEINSIERCVRSAVNQHYPNHHVYVLDDESTDGTTETLKKISDAFPDKLTVITGNSKPNDWLGKPWACHQLSQIATGDILIFIDADTWLEPEAVAKTVRMMGRDVVDLITLWPLQKLETFWEKAVIPLVYFALLTLLPARYVHRNPKWLPAILQKKLRVYFAAACGQFMAFKRNTYRAIGGHTSVKNQIVEDVALAKIIKRAGFSMKMYHGKDTVSCRMYRSSKELWNGFRKNFLGGFGNHLPLFTVMGLLQIITFVLPTAALPFLILFGTKIALSLCITAVALMLLQRFIIDRWFAWNVMYGLLHPVGVCWFQVLGVRVLLDYFNDEPISWKKRSL